MAKTIQVSPEQLESTAKKIESLAVDYKEQYDQLYSETNAMASKWRGEDNIAYVNQIEGFKDDFGKMHSLMNEYAMFLKNSAKAYRETQENVIAGAKKLVN